MAQSRRGSIQTATNGDLKVAATSAIDPVQWDEIGNLDEAVDLANEYENSESNRIFLFLAEKYITRADRKKFIETIINDHLERLISLPPGIDTTEARKRIPAKKIQH